MEKPATSKGKVRAEGLRKGRGAFFTPPVLADWLAKWAIRTPQDLVLEPSCGEAGFLLAAGQRLKFLADSCDSRGLAEAKEWASTKEGKSARLQGIEIHEESAAIAQTRLKESGLVARLVVGDFFDQLPEARFDAVIGNPPYVRYQRFSGVARTRGLEAALAAGVRLSGLASSWAAFVIHAAQFLKPEGRLGLVLPAELLTVNYAAEVRRFLLNRFGRVRLVLFETRVFPDVLEEVVLLLAEGQGGAPCFELHQARNLADLEQGGLCPDATRWTVHHPAGGEKWISALLPVAGRTLYHRLISGEGFAPLLAWGETWLGIVTGNNGFFALGRTQAEELGLAAKDLLPISPPGSRHLRGFRFTGEQWQHLAGGGEAQCLLFRPAGTADAAACRHIARGEAAGIHRAYKCGVRSPWWRVPLLAPPDLFLTYMNHDRPRLITNDAKVHILNSLYGVSLHPDKRSLGQSLLPLACLNSVSLLGAEVVGRSYGGGLLKLEPREADQWPLPSPALLGSRAEALSALQPVILPLLRHDGLERASALVDQVLLVEGLGISMEELVSLRRARSLLFERRRKRGQGEQAKGDKLEKPF